MCELSVVIPVYNEDRNIVPTIHRINECVPVTHEIICVYDFDEDTTVPVIRELQQQQYGQLRLAKNTIARGPSGAIRTGFREARGSRVLVVMADLCDDLSQVPQMLDLVPEHADVACPSRYCAGGRQLMEAVTAKVWFPKTAGFLLERLVALPTRDPTNSYKMYSADMLKSLELTSTIMFSVTLEVVVKAHCLGRRIVEIPTVWRDREHGASNFRIGPAVPAYFKWFLLALLRNRVFHLPASWFHARLATGSPGRTRTEG